MTSRIVKDTTAQPFAVSPDIYRYKWTITGGQIGTGYITFYADSTQPAQTFATGTSAFLNGAWAPGASGGLPTGIILTPDGIVDVVTAATGKLNGSSGITPPATITGSAAGTYAAPSGLAVTWTTAAFINGKRLKGRTFCVPLMPSKYQSDGTLDNTFLGAVRTAAGTYANGSWLPVVWHRPINGAGGSAAYINGYNVSDKVAVLTSRR